MADTATNLGRIESTAKHGRARTIRAHPVRLLQQYFYFFMSLLIAAAVVFGFSHTVEARLIHGVPRRPSLLWVHGVIFSGWVLFFIFQSLLVRTHNVRLHRTLGWVGAALGSAVFVMGIWIAVVMARFRVLHFQGKGAEAELALSFYDVTAFAVAFALAILWRKKTEYHRRLILLATCALTSAAFARFQIDLMPRFWFFVGVDLLVLLGVMRDLIVDKHVHRVYAVGLPVFVVCQSIVMYTILNNPPVWANIASAILR
ncbi:MAG TPA: hypothetical protein VFN62_09760 [Acidobacteriaceae bacterium]|nr:hypothetical protein [Acidobacteriaceae bacterium]